MPPARATTTAPAAAPMAGSPRWKAPSVADLLSDGDGSDDDDDDGEGLLGKATTDTLSGLLKGRTLGAALKATSHNSTLGGGGPKASLAPLGARAGGGSLAPLAPLAGRSFK